MVWLHVQRSVGWAKESDFQKKCQDLFLPWHNYTDLHQPQERYLRAAQSPESGALLFFQPPRPEHLLPRDASISSHPRGKQLMDFLWLQVQLLSLMSAWKAVLKKGTVHHWKWGALPPFLNETLELEPITYFSLTIFCFLCCNQTADALACCRAARFRMISPILSKWAKCTFHIQNYFNW